MSAFWQLEQDSQKKVQSEFGLKIIESIERVFMGLFTVSLLKPLVMLSALVVTPAYADCVSTCVDNGIDAAHVGTVELSTRCMEGGTTQPDVLDQFPDQCVGTTSLLEYSCNHTSPGHETVMVTRVTCSTDCTVDDGGRASCIRVETPSSCMKPVCPAPPPNCKYGPPKMEDGCPVDCGMLICSDPNPPNPPNHGNENNGNHGNGNNGNHGKKKDGKSKG